LSSEAVDGALEANFRRLRGCYERALQRDATMAGHILLRLVIDGSGAVSSASGVDSDLPPDVVQCIEREAGTLRFPEPKGGTFTVVVPFTFKPTTARGVGLRNGGSD
jgi:hypothetical protein